MSEAMNSLVTGLKEKLQTLPTKLARVILIMSTNH